MAQQILPSNTFTTAKWIVSATASDGTHTTIASALTSASSGDTIFIRPGTYTEDLTLKAGVNLVSYIGDTAIAAGTSTVIVVGKMTATYTGTVNICGIELRTNSDFCLTSTGANVAYLNLTNCNINALNNTALNSSNNNFNFKAFQCTGNIGTTAITLFTFSGAGEPLFFGCKFSNTGASTVASTCGVILHVYHSYFLGIALSISGSLDFVNSCFDTSAISTTALTFSGSQSNARGCQFLAGSASAVSISTTSLNLYGCDISSSNTNAITGAGSLSYNGLTFSGTSKTINVTTQPVAGTLFGSTTTAPTAGMLGEQIRGQASGISFSTGTAKNFTSISVTAGVWDISCVTDFTFSVAGAFVITGISTNTNSQTGTVLGDSQTVYTPSAATIVEFGQSIPSFRVLLASTTTYYLVGTASFASGTCTGAGRISATRVG